MKKANSRKFAAKSVLAAGEKKKTKKAQPPLLKNAKAPSLRGQNQRSEHFKSWAEQEEYSESDVGRRRSRAFADEDLNMADADIDDGRNHTRLQPKNQQRRRDTQP